MSEPLAAPYEHATEMHDHWWWRPGWRVGRHFYSIFATFEDQPELHGVINEWQNRLARVPGLDMVPREWRHLTIQGVGFADEVAEGQVDAIATELERALSRVPAARVQFGPLAIHQEALVLPAVPQEPVREVRSAIRSAIATELGGDQLDGGEDGYKPHVTIAYNSIDRDVPPKIANCATAAFQRADVTLRAVDLVEMNRDNGMYEWRSRRRLPLGISRVAVTFVDKWR